MTIEQRIFGQLAEAIEKNTRTVVTGSDPMIGCSITVKVIDAHGLTEALREAARSAGGRFKACARCQTRGACEDDGTCLHPLITATAPAPAATTAHDERCTCLEVYGEDPNCVIHGTAPAGKMHCKSLFAGGGHEDCTWPRCDCLKPETPGPSQPVTTSARTAGDDRATNPKTDDLLPVKSSASSLVHASDCAVHNMPAYPAGPCDCGAVPALADASQGKPEIVREWEEESAKLGGNRQIFLGRIGDRMASILISMRWGRKFWRDAATSAEAQLSTPAAPPVQGEGNGALDYIRDNREALIEAATKFGAGLREWLSPDGTWLAGPTDKIVAALTRAPSSAQGVTTVGDAE